MWEKIFNSEKSTYKNLIWEKIFELKKIIKNLILGKYFEFQKVC